MDWSEVVSVRVACVLALRLPVQVERQNDPSPAEAPLVVGGRPWDDGAVLDCCARAEAHGVHPGMRLARAEKLCSTARFVPPRERLDRELDVIKRAGLADYFLVAWDIARLPPQQVGFIISPTKQQGESAMKRPTVLTVTAILMLLTAAGTILFWAIFLADLDAQRESTFASRSDAWLAWELSFPLPDAWVATTAILGAVGLWRVRPSGLLFGLVSGGAMVFLGLIDLLFFLENGLYLPMNGEVAVELFIHVWATAFGLFAILATWRHRSQLINEVLCTHNP